MAEMMRLIEQSEFAAYLLKRQKASGMKGQEFCKVLGITRVAYSRLLNGHALPSQDVLSALHIRIAYVDDSHPPEKSAGKTAKAKKGTTDHEHGNERNPDSN